MRRTINLNGIPWIGWPKLMGLYKKSLENPRSAASFLAIFETGCRVSEAIMLKPEMFEPKPFGLLASRIPCRKRGSKKAGTIRIEPRDFIIPNDPLTADFKTFIESRKDKPYLFPRLIPLSGDAIEDRHEHTFTMYRDISGIDPILFPHFLRHQRASQLANEREPDPYKLREWFNWKSLDTSAEYIKGTLRDQAKWLGVIL
ncbi:hypothetical protein MUP77_10005 [Candidatus Bathyarchaeota archaeon]|nr:hypothetical protein [Candidatus Bathyarchaeota archaeon]